MMHERGTVGQRAQVGHGASRVIQAARGNTAKVAVDRYVKEKKYLKAVKITKKYIVHDEKNTASVGDIVELVYKGWENDNKCFKINQIVKEAQKYTNPINGKVYSV